MNLRKDPPPFANAGRRVTVRGGKYDGSRGRIVSVKDGSSSDPAGPVYGVEIEGEGIVELPRNKLIELLN